MINHKVPLLPGAHSLPDRYTAWLCDVWGVVHNGVAVFPEAIDALKRYRGNGGTVILITNAPRPSPTIVAQLEGLGLARSDYDSIVTSGDVTRDMVNQVGDAPIAHLGPTRDLPLIEDLSANFTPVDEAEYLLCSGLLDDNVETPADYADMLAAVAKRNVTMICANPDIVVQRGDRLIYCAGALAAEYQKHGGEVRYAGKPHLPVYDLCVRRLAEITGEEVDRANILAVGDGLKTDILGARQAGIDSLYVADGIHVADIVDGQGNPDQGRLNTMFENQKRPPVAAVFGLSW